VKPKWVPTTSLETAAAAALSKKNYPFGFPSVLPSIAYFEISDFIRRSSDSEENLAGTSLVYSCGPPKLAGYPPEIALPAGAAPPLADHGY